MNLANQSVTKRQNVWKQLVYFKEPKTNVDAGFLDLFAEFMATVSQCP